MCHCGVGDKWEGLYCVGILCKYWWWVALLPRITDQEGHLRGCDGLSGDDQVAFILAILRIKDNDEFSILYMRHSQLSVGVPRERIKTAIGKENAQV
jgi:hypothetical protein